MRRLLGFLGIVLLTAVIVVFVQDYEHIRFWMAYHTGSLNTPGTPPNYNYFSGFGSVFPWELGIFVAVWTWFATHYRLNNCHVEKCPRIGRFPVAGGHFKVCRHHHPEAHVRNKNTTFEHIQYAHALHLIRSGAGRLHEPQKKDRE